MDRPILRLRPIQRCRKDLLTERNDIYQKFYGTVNAKVGVRKGIVNVNLWSRNITNTHYSAFYFESFGNPFIQLGKPFQIGAEVAIAF